MKTVLVPGVAWPTAAPPRMITAKTQVIRHLCESPWMSADDIARASATDPTYIRDILRAMSRRSEVEFKYIRNESDVREVRYYKLSGVEHEQPHQTT